MNEVKLWIVVEELWSLYETFELPFDSYFSSDGKEWYLYRYREVMENNNCFKEESSQAQQEIYD